MMSNIFKPSMTYKPMTYQWAEEFRQASENMHWITDEVDMSKDLENFRLADVDESEYIKALLSIFTQSDFGVGNFYQDYLIPKVKNNEIRGMLTSFANREYEHMRGYAHLNESLGLPEAYYTDFLEHKATLDKWNFIKDGAYSDNFGILLAKQILTEGIALFSAFVMLKNFERFGKYLGTCKINEWSLNDETLHVEGNAKLFRVWAGENPTEIHNYFKKSIYDMTREIVQLEDNFIDFAFNNHKVEGLEPEDVKLYVKYIADRRLIQLGLKANFNVSKNPLPFMEVITNGSSMQNFFENRSADYSVSGMTGEWRYRNDR